ncbi:MAG: polyribonucleotide nucleotidyltransferase [Candidatus Melainabacteria bacterium]|jgi:polyribonucleotide nucleotidyltransferase|nr:polyribonucleotide nucleotidyltransferase [Candidatus Melainabacteria bacterium]
MFNEKKIEFKVGDKDVTVSTGKLAKQATSSVEIRCKNTVLLVTVTASEQPREGIDFFPLMVDFEEKLYSVGRIPGSYMRREGRASDKAVLICRLIDRPARPLFKEGYRNDVHVVILTLSVDPEVPPDTLGMLGAGFALQLAGLPFDGPFGAVRVAFDEDRNFIVNPSEEAQIASDLDIIVSGTADSIMMVEAGAKFVEDDKVVDAIAFAHEEIKNQVAKINEFAEMVGVTLLPFTPPVSNAKLVEIIEATAREDLMASMVNATKAKRKAFVATAKDKVKAAIEALGEDNELVAYNKENPKAIGDEMKQFEKRLLRKQIKETKVRADGRDPTTVRPISVEAGRLPIVHGDGLFTRGDTQVMSIVALATERMSRSLDGIDSETEKFYMHNYNFPAWSVGEVRPNRGPGRREIGHGALGERAIVAALPDHEDFAYAIRVVSEILESAGSTSMAATCASSLALFDAGVPMKCAVAGIAMGLIQEGDESIVLTDIHELEDFLGDMDFKVAGNEDGISALQMDIKIKGIAIETLRRAIAQAKDARLHILGKMNEIIPEPRNTLRGNAPRITTTTVPKDKIGAVIGPGGKNIKWIIEATGAEVNINDEGVVNIYYTEDGAGELAKEYVEISANGVKAGKVYEGEVVKVLDGVGAIVEMVAGASGLVHISQIAQERVEDLDKYVKVGDKVKVRVQGTDARGRTSLSMKEVDNPPKEAREEATAA